MAKKKEVSPVVPDTPLLPWETKGSDKTVEENLIDILGSDPDFQEEEDLEDVDELESDDDPEDEEDDDETEDDDDEDEDEEVLDDEDLEEDEDDKDDEEEDEDLEDDEDRTYDVKVQGETIKVNLEELQAGYSRTEDYTRKRQADVEEHAVEMTQVRDVRKTYTEHLEQLQAVMESMTPAEGPDEELRKSDPGEYAAQKQDHADKVAAVEKVAAERAKVQAEAQKEDDAARAVLLQSEKDKLIEAIPEWKNEAVQATGTAELRDFAKATYGFTDEEIDGVVDHRLLVLLHENMQNREKRKSGKKEIRRKSKGARKMKPGSTRGSRKVRGRAKTRKANQRSRERLAQTGGVYDAANAIEGLLGDDD
ncbi:MAG: hypothetical protein V3S55_14880 [Nitrospiraceae bacterium]